MIQTYCRRCGHEGVTPTILQTTDGPMVVTTMCGDCMGSAMTRFSRMKRAARFLERLGVSSGTVNRLFSWLVRAFL